MTTCRHAEGGARRAALLLASTFALIAGCSADGGSAPGSSVADAGSSDLRGTVTVAAATSLRGAFTELGDAFAADHPGVEVTFSFDGSSTLAIQLLEGAPADVFASADEASMAEVDAAQLLDGDPAALARNEMIVVTKPGNPLGIRGLADLAEAGVVALCAVEVPCGSYAQQVLEDAGVRLDERHVTRAPNATATLTAVTEGDAVAAIVYVTDAEAAGGDVATARIPDAADVTATYAIATLDGGDLAVSRAFVAFVLSDRGRSVLLDHGFLPPT